MKPKTLTYSDTFLVDIPKLTTPWHQVRNVA